MFYDKRNSDNNNYGMRCFGGNMPYFSSVTCRRASVYHGHFPIGGFTGIILFMEKGFVSQESSFPCMGENPACSCFYSFTGRWHVVEQSGDRVFCKWLGDHFVDCVFDAPCFCGTECIVCPVPEVCRMSVGWPGR